MTDLIGRTIAGKFVIESLIGQGAMGAVYCARQIALDKTVAIKVMHGDRAREPTLVARFRREARAASRLDHVHSIRVLDFGEDVDGLLYIAMEYFPGRPLSAIVSKVRPPRAELVVDVLSQALSAIAAAHALGIVHRDLKPDNILVLDGVDEDGRPRLLLKVCDFGIAHVLEVRAAGTKAPNDRLTTEGIILGTPYYMSPEQTRGHALDTRSDIYSMGVILYELLTGEVPFDGGSAFDVALAHCFNPPVPPRHRTPSANAGLEAICLRAMQKDPAARYMTAREMRAAVRALTSSSSSDEFAVETQPAFAPMPSVRSARAVVPPAATTASGAASSRPSPSPRHTPLSPDGPPDPALVDAASPDATPPAPRARRFAGARLAGIAVLLVGGAAVVVALRRAPAPRSATPGTPAGAWVGARALAEGEPPNPPESPSVPRESAQPALSAPAAPLSPVASSSPLPAAPVPGATRGGRHGRSRPAEAHDDRARANPSPHAHAAEDEATVAGPAVAPALPAPVTDSLSAPLAASSGAAPVPHAATSAAGGNEPTEPAAPPAAAPPPAAFDPSRARVDWAVTSTGGGATPAAFRHSLAHAAPGWTACYRAALSRAGHPSSGPATLRVTTDEEGNVVRAALDGFTLPGLASCLDGATRVHVDGADTGNAWAEIRTTFRLDESE
jgi:serine/threonine protein kinase